jgi:hypothetical protein
MCVHMHTCVHVYMHASHLYQDQHDPITGGPPIVSSIIVKLDTLSNNILQLEHFFTFFFLRHHLLGLMTKIISTHSLIAHCFIKHLLIKASNMAGPLDTEF